MRKKFDAKANCYWKRKKSKCMVIIDLKAVKRWLNFDTSRLHVAYLKRSFSKISRNFKYGIYIFLNNPESAES